MKKLIAIVCCVGIFSVPLAWAEGPLASIYDTVRSRESGYDWTFSAALEYLTGRLDTSVTTRTGYLPFTLQRNMPRSRVAVTLPYISQRTTIDVADREGRLYQVNTTGTTSYTTSAGLSDILLKGAYDYKRQKDGDKFDLSWVGKIKFPSADHAKGFGTDETDVSIGAEGFRRLEDSQWFLMGDMYYTNIGDQPANKLNNEFALSMGAGYQWPESHYLSASYEEKTALSEDRPRPRNFIFHYGHPISEDSDFTGNIIWGLSEGAPDFGIGVGVNVRF